MGGKRLFQLNLYIQEASGKKLWSCKDKLSFMGRKKAWHTGKREGQKAEPRATETSFPGKNRPQSSPTHLERLLIWVPPSGLSRLEVAFSRLIFSRGVSATYPGTASGHSVVSTGIEASHAATPFQRRGLGRHGCRGWKPLGTINMTNNHRKEVESEV